MALCMSMTSRTGRISSYQIPPMILFTVSQFTFPPPGVEAKGTVVRRSFWERGLWLWLWDMWHNTPLIEAEDIPQRRQEYTTSRAYSRLVADHGTAVAERACMCTHRLYWLWNNRSEREMEVTREQGRWVVYDRMRLFNPAPVKQD